ncbi:FolC bifunctional protein [Rippkaea orientalis PCC 8801]|uniref:tetrahydrofolate synthase n=1 Tax=Rippkaea orientalis (strain PCC 8801 / RF-1) TaxID=41431 RepID=B7K204_RIPO1|nr:folylpolyglutamate synthase/dihydrofolate synthase family protein [Rippkaea orientalis]ACK64311.1 FolC bifunctional protein [Rippkaea orientalis PCC 8801]
MSTNSLLEPFERFGINLGLDRIKHLLQNFDNPHDQVPIIHVGGTNGKGSVCAYLSSILTEAGYQVGRYTSPYLIDQTESICINNQPISEADFTTIFNQIKTIIECQKISLTKFEVLTAIAWIYFAQQKVDIAILEVGLGGRLDATNICDHPLVTVITSISRDHCQELGSKLTDIAYEKAGIFKLGSPAIIAQIPLEAQQVMEARLQALNCPITWVKSAIKSQENWAIYDHIHYPLPLLGEIQLSNSALAIETIKLLQQKGWNIPLTAIQKGMEKTQWLGRLQWIQWQDKTILIDGAHNQASAQALRQYIESLNQPVTWIIGLLSTKEHEEIFQALFRPDDTVYLVPVPDEKTANPEKLSELAIQLCPELKNSQAFSSLWIALETAVQHTDHLIVLSGSLYLVGYFLRKNNAIFSEDCP